MQPVAAKPFILPDATFLFELVSFFIVLYVLWKYVLPPLQRAMDQRQETIKRQLEESREAKERLEKAEQEFKEALTKAKSEASRLREEAYAEGKRIVEEMRVRAREEAAVITAAAQRQLEIDRQRAMGELRAEIGRLAVDLASRIVGESLEDEARRSRTVDRFIEELDATSGERAEAAAGTDGAGQG